MKAEILGLKVGRGMEVGGIAMSTGSAIGGYISQNAEIIWAAGIAAGILFGAIGVIITLVFKIRADRRDAEKHRAEMMALQAKTEQNRGTQDGQN